MAALLIRAAAIALSVLASPALAQRVTPAANAPASPELEAAASGYFEEDDGLVVFGSDREGRPRALRIEASGTVPEAPLGDGVTAAASCAGTRWLVRARADGHASIGPAGGPPRWERGGASGVDIHCFADRVVIGYVEGHELVLQQIAPSTEHVQRVDVAPQDVEVSARWELGSEDVLYVLTHQVMTSAVELLRVRLEDGAITHRRPLGARFASTFALTSIAVVVGTSELDASGITIRPYARMDLLPGRSASVRVAPDHSVEIDGLWPGPHGVVAVWITEGWAEPTRGYRQVPSLRMFRSGTLGPAREVGEGRANGGAWLGETLVVLDGQPGERFLTSVIRRFGLHR